MQTKLKTIIVSLFLIITASSCDSYLDLRPQDGIVRDEFWKTKEDIQAAVIGIYSSLLTSPPGVSDLTMTEYLFMYGELRGGVVIEGVNATEDQRDIMETNVLPSNPLTDWSIFYRTINYCNTVIDMAPAVKEQDPTLTQTQLNAFLSEAYAIRAYLYFTLARTFKDVPLKLTATMSDKDDFQIPASKQSDVFAQVIKDLKLAEQYGVETYGNTASDKGRVTKNTINAMLADVYLWTESYQDASAAADKVINSGKFRLVDGGNASTWFNTVFARGNSTESIFEFQYSATNMGPFNSIFSLRPQFKGYALMMDEVYGFDPIDPVNRKDIRGDKAALVGATGEIYKFTGLNNDEKKEGANSDTHWFVYRYADVLLMKAEALTRLGQGKDALAIINELRLKRQALSVTDMAPGEGDTNGIIDFILAERNRELAFEGKRWYDILRIARANNYERKDMLIQLAIATAPPDKQQSIIAKLKDPNSHYLPINTNELFTNKALVQNPFYK